VLLEEMRGQIQVVLEVVAAGTERTDRLAAQMADGFRQVNAGFVAVAARFDKVDARFAAIDSRFDRVDARFEAVDARLDKVDSRFEAVDAQLDAVRADIADLASVVARKADASALTALEQRVTLLERGARA
jgi:predicted  nucleic acid-binding Zn-ribbon protein